jgi:hypothetical protein
MCTAHLGMTSLQPRHLRKSNGNDNTMLTIEESRKRMKMKKDDKLAHLDFCHTLKNAAYNSTLKNIRIQSVS